MGKSKILIVDDDQIVREMIKETLEKENMIVIEASSEKEALEVVETEHFDLILLDLMLEDTDGLDLLTKFKTKNINSPIIILSGKDEDIDKIIGLGVGADEYITKPFSLAVLAARIKAHIRRTKKIASHMTTPDKLIKGPFTFEYKTYRFFKNHSEIFLSSKEIMLMKFFLENPEQVFSKEQLYENVWCDSFIDDNTITVYISHLRNKIEENPKKPVFIKTVWGLGYKLTLKEYEKLK